MTELERPVRAGTLRSQVVGILRNAIFYGKLQPDSMLRELPLARNLQASQSTVREALAVAGEVPVAPIWYPVRPETEFYRTEVK
jgi:hypothetical protein